MFFVGQTRFSLYEPKSGSWRLTRALGAGSASDVEDYRKTLFAGARLNSRIAIFLGHSLPILDRARKGRKIIHVVSYSEELPSYYQRLLNEAAAKYSWLKLDRRIEGNRQGQSVDEVVRDLARPGEVGAIYRLDDDDVLASSYFDQLEPYVAEHNVGNVISLGYGIIGLYGENKFSKLRIEHAPKIALGLARVVELQQDGRVLGAGEYNHTKYDLRYPVILDSRRISFLHTMHSSQDTFSDRPKSVREQKMKEYLDLPRISNLDKLEKLFPGVQFQLD